MQLIKALNFLGLFLFTIIQRGGAHRDQYADAAESNGFIGTIGSLIVGGVIWWIIISSSGNSKHK